MRAIFGFFPWAWGIFKSQTSNVYMGLDVFNRHCSLRKIRLLCLGIFSCLLTSCALITPVSPWEKGFLAKPEMTFEVDVLDQSFTEHTYFSKEGSFGGAGVGGGGCGCN